MVKAKKFMYVDGLNHNLLSVSQMCDQGNEFVFSSKQCVVRKIDKGKTMIKGTRTPRNLYILKGGQENATQVNLQKIGYGTEDWDI